MDKEQNQSYFILFHPPDFSLSTVFLYAIVQYFSILAQIASELAMTFHSKRKYTRESKLCRKNTFLYCLNWFVVVSLISLCTLKNKNTTLLRPRNTAQSSGGTSAGDCLHFKARCSWNSDQAPGSILCCSASLISSANSLER